MEEYILLLADLELKIFNHNLMGVNIVKYKYMNLDLDQLTKKIDILMTRDEMIKLCPKYAYSIEAKTLDNIQEIVLSSKKVKARIYANNNLSAILGHLADGTPIEIVADDIERISINIKRGLL